MCPSREREERQGRKETRVLEKMNVLLIPVSISKKKTRTIRDKVSYIFASWLYLRGIVVQESLRENTRKYCR